VEVLKNTMPVVISLSDRALTARHWEQINEILNEEINIHEEGFTL
jgi:hypothetical protein